MPWVPHTLGLPPFLHQPLGCSAPAGPQPPAWSTRSGTHCQTQRRPYKALCSVVIHGPVPPPLPHLTTTFSHLLLNSCLLLTQPVMEEIYFSEAFWVLLSLCPLPFFLRFLPSPSSLFDLAPNSPSCPQRDSYTRAHLPVKYPWSLGLNCTNMA